MSAAANVRDVVALAMYDSLISMGENPIWATSLSAQLRRWIDEEPKLSRAFVVREDDGRASVVEANLEAKPVVMVLPVAKWMRAARRALNRIPPAP